jgi:hypothetical protein
MKLLVIVIYARACCTRLTNLYPIECAILKPSTMLCSFTMLQM